MEGSFSSLSLLLKTLTADHGQEESKLWVERDDVPVGEDELLPALLLRHQHDVDLLRGDRQRRQLDTIELVEATPRAGHRQT